MTSYDDVFSLDNAVSFGDLNVGDDRRTFTGADFAEIVAEAIGFTKDWAKEGVPCRYLSGSGNPPGWRKGRVRISVEFIPDPPQSEPKALPEQTEPRQVDAEVIEGDADE